MLKRLGHGDVLMVPRLDRMARSTRDLLNTWMRSCWLQIAGRRLGGYQDAAWPAYADGPGRACRV